MVAVPHPRDEFPTVFGASQQIEVLLFERYGIAAGDRDALADIIMRVSALVDIVPEIQELDLNPVKVLEPANGAVVVDARMRVGR